MTIDERRERAVQRLGTIYRDVQDLILDDHIFWELQDIVRGNRRLAEARSHFKHWTMAAHVESAAIGIRRQIKQDKDSISLRGFLEETKQFPQIVSREYHVSLCTKLSDNLPREFHESTFDRLVGPGRAEVDPTVVQAEIDEFLTVASSITQTADSLTMIAAAFHNARSSMK